LSLSSSIVEILSMGSNTLQTTVESMIEDTAFEKYSDVINPLINIASSIVWRQAAGAAINYAPSLGYGNQSNAPLSFLSTHDNYFEAKKTKGMLDNILTKVWSFTTYTDITSNNQSNIVSTALNAVAQRDILHSILNLGKSVFNIMTQDNSLSVYDIKKIMSDQVGYKITKEQAKDAYNKFQACEEYYNKQNDATKAKIDIIANMYSRAYGNKQKELMTTSIASDFLDKSFKLIDMQIQCDTIERLLAIKENVSLIRGCHKIGLIVSNAQKGHIKNMAIIKLNAELHEMKQLYDISADEAVTYKSLYLQAANIEVELNALETMWSAFEAHHDNFV